MTVMRAKKSWLGASYPGGIHTAAAGGVCLIIIKDFAGFELRDEGARFKPALPKAWKAAAFQLSIGGCLLHVRMDGEGIRIRS
jgi:kojibiose phosphorylase